MKDFLKEGLTIYTNFRKDFEKGLKNYEYHLVQFIVEFNKILFIFFCKIDYKLLIDTYYNGNENEDIECLEECLYDANI